MEAPERLLIRRAQPDEVLDGVADQVERLVGLVDRGTITGQDLRFRLLAIMLTVGTEAIRLRDEAWAPGAGA